MGFLEDVDKLFVCYLLDWVYNDTVVIVVLD